MQGSVGGETGGMGLESVEDSGRSCGREKRFQVRESF